MIVMDRTTNVGELWVQPLDGDGKAFPYVKALYSAQGGQISPDGGWLAYRSDETGDFEIYVDLFPRSGRKLRVSLSAARGLAGAATARSCSSSAAIVA